MSAPLVRRIVLRLDPLRAEIGALAAVARLASAFHAELAARLVSDTRIASAMIAPMFRAGVEPQAMPPMHGLEAALRRAEQALRRAMLQQAEREPMAWSFEVVECAGVLAREYEMHTDDLIALELPPAEVPRSELRDEVAGALARARGVLLFPSQPVAAEGPVVAILRQPNAGDGLLATGGEIAQVLGSPLRTVAPERREADAAAGLARAVRKLKALLAIVAADDPVAAEFLRRPRWLRELNAPLLLLNAVAE